MNDGYENIIDNYNRVKPPKASEYLKNKFSHKPIQMPNNLVRHYTSQQKNLVVILTSITVFIVFISTFVIAFINFNTFSSENQTHFEENFVIDTTHYDYESAPEFFAFNYGDTITFSSVDYIFNSGNNLGKTFNGNPSQLTSHFIAISFSAMNTLDTETYYQGNFILSPIEEFYDVVKPIYYYDSELKNPLKVSLEPNESIDGYAIFEVPDQIDYMSLSFHDFEFGEIFKFLPIDIINMPNFVSVKPTPN